MGQDCPWPHLHCRTCSALVLKAKPFLFFFLMQVVVPPTFGFPDQAETIEQRIEIDSNNRSFIKPKSSSSFFFWRDNPRATFRSSAWSLVPEKRLSEHDKVFSTAVKKTLCSMFEEPSCRGPGPSHGENSSFSFFFTLFHPSAGHVLSVSTWCLVHGTWQVATWGLRRRLHL